MVSTTDLVQVASDSTGGSLVEAPYAPGIPVRQIVRASLGRFLPESVLSLGAVLTVATGVGLDRAPEFIAMVMGASAVTTVGYGCSLGLLRRRLYPDADVSGRRSTVAGLMSPLALFSAVVLGMGASPAGALTLFFVTGVAMAVLMFFAWLTPTPERERRTIRESRPC